MAVHLAVASNVYGGVFLCCPFSHEMSLVGSWTQLSQFLRVFLPTLELSLEELFMLVPQRSHLTCTSIANIKPAFVKVSLS